MPALTVPRDSGPLGRQWLHIGTFRSAARHSQNPISHRANGPTLTSPAALTSPLSGPRVSTSDSGRLLRVFCSQLAVGVYTPCNRAARRGTIGGCHDRRGR